MSTKNRAVSGIFFCKSYEFSLSSRLLTEVRVTQVVVRGKFRGLLNKCSSRYSLPHVKYQTYRNQTFIDWAQRMFCLQNITFNIPYKPIHFINDFISLQATKVFRIRTKISFLLCSFCGN